MNNFITRTLSAVVYAGVVIVSILVQPECFGNHMLLFGIVFMIVSTLAVREFHKLVGGSDAKIQSYSMIANALLFCALYFFFYGDLVWRPLLFAYVAILMLTMILHLFREKVNAIQSWGNLCAGQLMIALPFALMSGIALYDKWLIFALFILIWVNDCGAYIVGSLMAKRKGGNHKMFLRVSPAKSWEGLIGGFVFDLIAGYIFYLVGWTSTIGLTAYPLLDSLLFALVIGIFGTIGDLMESLMKRTIGVKDSGKFMPGHGGVLDRFDSLLLAVPAVYFLFVYLPSIF